MQRWNIAAADAATGPRVLFSSPEARGVLVDLAEGASLGTHRVRERALVHVVAGTLTVAAAGERARCETGSLVVLDPGEEHSVHAEEPSRFLLVLAPWPAPGHFEEDERGDPHVLPANATQAAE